MGERINVAELLKDCPNGMELDCTMYDEVSFIHVLIGNTYPIKIETPDGQVSLDKYGCYSNNKHAKCVIFPKDKTTWEGFQKPFKDGDILAVDSCIFIIQKLGDNNTAAKTHYTLYDNGDFDDGSILYFDIDRTRLATEEEKERLFNAIKNNGYHWNAETKTLEKIKPKFEIGDKIVDTLRKHMGASGTRGVISKITDNKYIFTDGSYMSIGSQDNWELVPNKFDITTLKPFDKVLVRNTNNGRWHGQFYMSYDKNEEYPFECTYNCWMQCISFEGNEHLHDKTDDCDNYYKNWE